MKRVINILNKYLYKKSLEINYISGDYCYLFIFNALKTCYNPDTRRRRFFLIITIFYNLDLAAEINPGCGEVLR